MSDTHGPVRALVERAYNSGRRMKSWELSGINLDGHVTYNKELLLLDELSTAADALDARQWERVEGALKDDEARALVEIDRAGFTVQDMAGTVFLWPDDGYEYAIMRRPKGDAE